jgi:hypothetical protein
VKKAVVIEGGYLTDVELKSLSYRYFLTEILMFSSAPIYKKAETNGSSRSRPLG